MGNAFMKINKDIPIGRVLFIVEGSSTEFTLLRRIFCNVLGFEYIEKRRNRPSVFYKRNNPLSTIAVINTSDSNIKDIFDDEYLDELFQMLINDYHFPVDKASIYYLFDRDPASNTDVDAIRQYIDILTDPLDNDDGMKAGLLLLSYPCVESYMVSSFQRNAYEIEIGIGDHVKTYIGQHNAIQMNKISEETLLLATEEFLTYLRHLDLVWDIDDFSKTSRTVFELQEEKYASKGVYNLFSMLTLSFIQLGIIEIDELELRSKEMSASPGTPPQSAHSFFSSIRMKIAASNKKVRCKDRIVKFFKSIFK